MIDRSTGLNKVNVGKTKTTAVGNIDINNRPQVKNKNGSISTVASKSFNFGDGKETLIPTVRKGLNRTMTDKESIAYYQKTGEHLGKFASVQAANEYAVKLHKQQADLLRKKK